MAEANPNSMSARAEDRSVEIDLSNLGEQVDDIYQALFAFNFMLEFVNEYSVSRVGGKVSYGMSQLVRRQLDDLKDTARAVDVLVDRLREAKKASADARASLSEDFVVIPNYRPGLEHELRAQAAVDPNPIDRLRAADLGQIARDTNLKEDTVRRVLERLLADPDPQERPAVSNG